jgi:predicted nucleic acid-binding protein
MVDIVIDTCTLKHANDPNSKYFESSVEFITKMLANTTICVVDEGFTLDESTNQSYIGLEFIKHLKPGSLGYNLILHFIQNVRLEFVSNKIPNNHKKYIEQIIRNKKDRMFLRVAYNTSEQALISHDFTDYQKRKRKKIKKDLSINIVTAGEINPEI